MVDEDKLDIIDTIEFKGVIYDVAVCNGCSMCSLQYNTRGCREIASCSKSGKWGISVAFIKQEQPQELIW